MTKFINTELESKSESESELESDTEWKTKLKYDLVSHFTLNNFYPCFKNT